MAVNKTKVRGREVNRADLSEINGVSLPTVDEWVRRGCPVVQRGGRGRAWKFNTAEVRSWRDDDIRSQADHGPSATKEQLILRKLAAETEQVELDLARAREQVVPVDQLERALQKAFGEVRAGLRNVVPSRTARRLIGETDETAFKEVMLEEIDQALTALADNDLIFEEDIEGAEGEEDEGAKGE